MRASVIIPTRNRSDLLQQTVARLARQTVPNDEYEILIVDDASDEPCTVTLRAAADPARGPRMQLIQRARRGWSATARNDAIAQAQGDILVFLDDDAFVGPQFLERHLVVHGKHPAAVVAGPIVQVRAIPEAIDESSRLTGYHRHPLPGGNGSVPAWAVRRVGGYDAEFRAYGWQDQELAERLLALGLRRRFAWGAPIYHYKPASYDTDLRAQIARERERGRMGARFYHKHRSWTIGVTTKVAPTVRRAVNTLARLTRTPDLCDQLESGERDGATVPTWRAALLRAWVESNAGGAELARISASAGEG
ncbi:MAG: glycosyltransferase family 2 protein [Gemmatimonadaceae bacterium]